MGTGTSGNTGDGGAATSARINAPLNVVVDSAGNSYLADYSACVIRKVNTSGIISTVAGTGTCSISTDGGQATATALYQPSGLAVDSSNNLYIAEFNASRVRRVNSSGVISTFAGTGTAGSTGDGGAATSARLTRPVGLALDSAQNLYIADSGNNRIRKVSGGVITTVVGTGTAGGTGDGGQATSAQINVPYGVALDTSGNLYVAELTGNRVRKINTSGVITTASGTGTAGFSGDGGVATSAQLRSPAAVGTDAQGNIYIADSANYRIRQIDTSGLIKTIAGTGTSGFTGNGGPATSAKIGLCYGLYVTSTGQIYIGDYANHAVRVLSASRVSQLPSTAVNSSSASTSLAFGLVTGLGSTVSLKYGAEFSVNNAACSYTSSPSFQATCPVTFSPLYPGLRWDALILEDSGGAVVSTQYIYGLGQGSTPAITPGVITTINAGSAGALSSEGVVFDPAGIMYITDGPNNRIVKNASGTFSVFTITGLALSNPKGLVSDGAGNLYVSDTGNNRVVIVAPDGTATDLGITGLSAPAGLAMDANRTLYIADTGNARIVTYSLVGTTAVLAVSPTLTSPTGLAFADDGTLYISDPGTPSIVKVTSAGVSSTLTVTGATVSSPSGLATDRAGNLYVANSNTNVVYRIKADGSALAVAGTGTAGYSGDGGISTSAAISAPKAVFLGRSGSIYFSDSANGKIRQVAGSATVAFPNTAVNGTNNQTVLFSNIGNAALTLPASFTFAQSPSKFSLINSGSSDCSALLGSSLASAATCTLESQFAPTAAVLTLDTVALTGGAQITFNGTGIAVAISSVNTNSLSFGSQPAATTSTGQTVTLSNTGTGTLNIASAALSGANAAEFALTNNCGASLAAGANCTISVTFTPASIAAKTATLTITASDAGSSANLNQTVSLSGTGVGTGAASLSAAAVGFGNVTSGSTSAAQTVTITNSGTGVLNITSAVISGANAADFTAVNNCAATLAASAQCTVSLTFHPSSIAAKAATLTVTTADATTLTPVASTVSLSGAGVGTGSATVSSTPINFGSVASGTTSSAHSVTITNSGNGVLNITSAVISGANAADFSVVNNCGATLAVAAQCTVSLTFHPSSIAAKAATLTVTTSDATTLTPVNATVALSGAGVGIGSATVSSTPINFGSVTSGATSSAQSVTITNSGTGVLNITSAVISGANAADFSVVNNCGATLAVAAQCAVSLTFHPSSIAAKAATLTVTTADATTLTPVNATVALSGAGVGIGSATVSSTPINFGSVTSGATSSAQSVTITNSGTGVLNITSAVISGANAADFTVVNNCGATLTAAAQCTVTVAFHPSAAVAETATLTVTTADATTLTPITATIALSGTGVVGLVGTATVNTTPINFGSLTTGSTSAAQVLTLTNSGTGTLNVTSAVISGANAADFALASSCSSTLAANASCTLSITFQPSAAGLETALLTITDADAISLTPATQTVTLTGTGTAAAVGTASLSVSSLAFENTAPGDTAAAQIVTVTNSGMTVLNLAGASLSGSNAAEFTLTDSCTAILAPGASCTAQIVFAPSSTGGKTATLVFSFGVAPTLTTKTVALTGISSVIAGAVPRGVMSIISLNSGRALDVLNASTLNGAPLQQYDYVGGENQMWRAVPVDSTYYKIVSVGSGKVLDGKGKGTADGTLVQQWNYLGGDNQKWEFIPQEDGSFEIVNKASGKALDVVGVSKANQALMQLWSYNSTDNQKWQLTAITLPAPAVQYYAISSLSTGKVLDTLGASTMEQARIQQYDYLHGANQEWQLVPTTGGYYQIINRLSGKVLDAQSGAPGDGAPVQQYTYLGLDNQQWQLVPTVNGYYQIVNKASGKSLDITGMSSVNGALLQTYTYLDGPNQQFELIPVVGP